MTNSKINKKTILLASLAILLIAAPSYVWAQKILDNEITVEPCTTKELAEDSCGGPRAANPSIKAISCDDTTNLGYTVCTSDQDCINLIGVRACPNPDACKKASNAACKRATYTCGTNHYTRKLCVDSMGYPIYRPRSGPYYNPPSK